MPVTFFIIIGIILFVFAFLYLIVQGYNTPGSYFYKLRSQQTDLEVGIQNCLGNLIENWLFVFGAHSGRPEADNARVLLSGDMTAQLPDPSSAQHDLAVFLSSHVADCLDSDDYPSHNLTIYEPGFKISFMLLKTAAAYEKLYLDQKDTGTGTSGSSFTVDRSPKIALQQLPRILADRKSTGWINSVSHYNSVLLQGAKKDNTEYWLIDSIARGSLDFRLRNLANSAAEFDLAYLVQD